MTQMPGADLWSNFYGKENNKQEAGMNQYHTTAEGKRMLISQMESDHLENYIKMRLAQVLELEKRATAEQAGFKAQLAGAEPIDIRKAVRASQSLLNDLQPYLVEAYIRDLKAPREQIQMVVGRTDAIPQDLLAIDSGEAIYVEDDEEEATW